MIIIFTFNSYTLLWLIKCNADAMFNENLISLFRLFNLPTDWLMMFKISEILMEAECETILMLPDNVLLIISKCAIRKINSTIEVIKTLKIE